MVNQSCLSMVSVSGIGSESSRSYLGSACRRRGWKHVANCSVTPEVAAKRSRTEPASAIPFCYVLGCKRQHPFCLMLSWIWQFRSPRSPESGATILRVASGGKQYFEENTCGKTEAYEHEGARAELIQQFRHGDSWQFLIFCCASGAATKVADNNLLNRSAAAQVANTGTLTRKAA